MGCVGAVDNRFVVAVGFGLAMANPWDRRECSQLGGDETLNRCLGHVRWSCLGSVRDGGSGGRAEGEVSERLSCMRGVGYVRLLSGSGRHEGTRAAGG